MYVLGNLHRVNRKSMGKVSGGSGEVSTCTSRRESYAAFAVAIIDRSQDRSSSSVPSAY